MTEYNVPFDDGVRRILAEPVGSVWEAVALRRESVAAPHQVMRWWTYLVPDGVGWQPWRENREYVYRDWLLARVALTYADFMEQLRTWAAGEPFAWGDTTWMLPDPSNANWDIDRWWAYSSSQYRHRLIPRTTRHFRLSVSGGARLPNREQDDAFAAPGQPYFPTPRDALRCVVDGIPSPLYGDSLSEVEIGLFVLDDRPRIEHVWVRRADSEVTVGGPRGEECELKLFTSEPWDPIRVMADGPIVIPWHETPQSAEWVLTSGHEVIDRKAYNGHPVFGSGYQVEVDWGEPETLHQWVALGEGPNVEFKRDLPKNWEDIAETVCAFANSDGGKLFVGVDDHGQVVGTRLTEKWEEALRNGLRNWIEPTVDFALTSVRVSDGLNVAVIDVPAGDGVYAVNRDRPVWYLRRGSTDMPARRADVETMLVEKALRSLPPSRSGPFGL